MLTKRPVSIQSSLYLYYMFAWPAVPVGAKSLGNSVRFAETRIISRRWSAVNYRAKRQETHSKVSLRSFV